jgi:hypothetical protein
MNLREIAIQEILSKQEEQVFEKSELESLEDIELFHLLLSEVRRDAWQSGFENGHFVGYQEGSNSDQGMIQLQIDTSDLQMEDPSNEEQI